MSVIDTDTLVLPEDRRTLEATTRDLSAGNVVEIRPTGPVLRKRLGRRRTLRRGTFVRLLSSTDRLVVAVLTAGWLMSLVLFWMWWLQPAHRVSSVGLGVNSLLMLYLSCQPIYFFVAVNRLRQVNPALHVPALRVGFVVTRAPAEPWAMARRTLSAMLDQQFPASYDVWLCDEEPTEEIRSWCRERGVQVSSRHGIASYQRAVWPRRAKCKEGNLAYFYDHWGYRDYDVVAQLDCDHVPEPTYLSEVVRAFADPAVGYVAAPSVCDANASASWSARGRLHREASFHGPIQAGHSDGLAPVCIGSHYAVRTAAVREIGGLGPELAEDFSTSFLLNSAGWHGAFALDAEAHGDGPITFAAMAMQEFQWSRSLTSSLYDLLPQHLGRLPWRLRLRFLFALTFYGLLSVTTLAGILLPPVAAVTGMAWINVNYLDFLTHWWLLSAWCLAMTLFLRHRGMQRPRRAPVISWELWLYALARWPFVAFGVAAATLQKFRPRPILLKVTPKSRAGLEPLHLRLVLPFVTITLALSSAAIAGELTSRAAGYVLLCLLGATSYAAVALSVTVLHAVEVARAARVSVRSVVAATIQLPLLLSTAALLPLAAAIDLYPAYAMRVFGW
jgi:cellulose synthase/poly-beta-1,6-N-acetylglucosamine synthase-like glycosyltransferase